MKQKNNIQAVQTMIYLSNIPGRKYKLPRKKKKSFIKDNGRSAYTYQRMLFFLKDNGLSKTLESLKEITNKVIKATTFIATTLESIFTKMDNLIRTIIMLKLECNIPKYTMEEIPVLDGVIYELKPTV